MSERSLQTENAAFKEWYINNGHLKPGRWSFVVFEISSGLRFAVMDECKLQEVWRKEVKGYERKLQEVWRKANKGYERVI